MARLLHGTTSFFPTMCSSICIIIMVMVMLLAGTSFADCYLGFAAANGSKVTACPFTCTNSCTIIWVSRATRPTMIDLEQATLAWMRIDMEHGVPDTEDLGFDLYDLTSQMDKVKPAIKEIEWATGDWPELDLQWCLAEWHNGRLIGDSLAAVGETCWWWSMGDYAFPRSFKLADIGTTWLGITKPQVLTWVFWGLFAGYCVEMLPIFDSLEFIFGESFLRLLGKEMWTANWPALLWLLWATVQLVLANVVTDKMGGRSL